MTAAGLRVVPDTRELAGRTPDATTRRVVLLHGIWMPAATMAWHAAQLRRAGFECEVFGYYGAARGHDIAMRGLVGSLGRTPTHILAHSLGGLVALTALLRNPDLPVERVVCLGTPLRGSRAAHQLRSRRWTAFCLGHAADLLDRGLLAWTGRAEVGMIAGTRRLGLGQLFAAFDGDHDGTVAVDETRLPGVADHILLPDSHASLLLSREASRQAIAFFRQGRFLHAPILHARAPGDA